MGIFDKRKERDKEKADSPIWQQAYVPSYSFITDKAANPCGAFALNEGISTRLLKKPSDFYEETKNFVLILISSTDKKIIDEIPYDKAIKALDNFKQDETKEELLVRPLTYQELKELAKA
ncbi:MAG: hypothetical protein J6Y08_09655 [Clostridiales bacterium]|nr:hypothetical protein [Clostridiales bacterium]